MQDIDAVIAIPCVDLNPLVQKCVVECRTKCPGAEIYVAADIAPGLAHVPGATVLVTGPLTMSAKRNMVAQRSAKTYLALIDSDAFPDHQWLQSAITVLERQPDTWIVGGPNISPSDQPQDERWVGAAQRSYLVTGAYSFRKQRSPARFVDDLPSCNMVLRRQDYLSIGGMREELYQFEDKELCARVIAANKKIYFTPDVTIFHKDRSFKSFAIQRLTWGASLWKGMRTSGFRLYLLMPTLAVLWFLSLPFVLLLPYGAQLYLAVLVLYFVLVGAEAMRRAQRAHDLPGVFAAIVIGNLGPGLGSILGPLGFMPDLRKIYRHF